MTLNPYSMTRTMQKLALPLLLLAGLSACEKPAPASPPPRPAMVMQLGEPDGLAHGNWLTGEVKARYESAQGFRIAGKILQRYVEVGDQVKRGQPLARLDAEDTRLSAASAQADLAAAEAELSLAETDQRRQHKLYEQQFISAAALDNVQTRLKSTQARVAQARAQAGVARNQTQYTLLTAERDGVVTSINAEPGQVVSAGEVIARVAVPNTLEVQIAIPEAVRTSLQPGDATSIRLWSHREQVYEGRIREIAPAADTLTRTFQARVTILQPDSHMQIGMTAGVRLAAQTAGFIVPSTAVARRGDQAEVWVVDAEKRVHPKTVSIGEFSEQGVNILAGLDGNETLVVAGVHTLVDGQQVNPTPMERQP